MKKRQISDEQLNKIESLGYKIGSNKFIQKTVLRISSMSSDIKKKLLVGLLTIASITAIISLFLKTEPLTKEPSFPSMRVPISKEEIRYIDKKMISDLSYIADSITTILTKEHISKEESIYVFTNAELLEKYTNPNKNKTHENKKNQL